MGVVLEEVLLLRRAAVVEAEGVFRGGGLAAVVVGDVGVGGLRVVGIVDFEAGGPVGVSGREGCAGV